VENLAASLSRQLFADAEAYVYAVLDGASVPDLLAHLDRYEPEYVCLYRGELEPDMEEVAPYLIRVEPDSEFAEWLIEQGWGRHWGIYARSPEDLAAVRRHFRTFLIVHDSNGKPLYFRYYDPRVLRVYLPTCNAAELATIFGPIQSYVLEGERPGHALQFSVASGALQQLQTELERG
jgi:hypothetical protein